MSDASLPFTEGPLSRRLLAFALPLMAVNLLQYVYQVVNGLFYASMHSFDSFALGAGSPRLVLANSLIDALVDPSACWQGGAEGRLRQRLLNGTMVAGMPFFMTSFGSPSMSGRKYAIASGVMPW